MRQKNILKLVACVIAICGIFFAFVQPLANSIRQGLDLQGGTHVVLEAEDTDIAKVDNDAMVRVVSIMEKRVNELGLAEPIIQREGERRVIIELPGIKDPDAAIQTIGKTAMLEFRDEDGNVVLTGNDLADARAATNQTNNQQVVNLEFTSEGAKKFADLTMQNVGRTIAILLDGEVLTDPVVREPILGGRAEISGQRTLEEAQRLAVLLRSGALPVKVNIIETRTVGPSLGQDSKDKSEFAFVIGIGAVLIFMLAFYRMSGFIADISLMAYTILLLAILKGLDATLTLPGVAGIILSIGMAVDANVLIFEHFKEEFRTGKTLRLSMDSGFDRAFTTILDSNLTTIIAAGVLFFFGTGSIRGFAITLGLGVVLSMFTAITLTQYMLKLMIAAKIFESPSAYGADGFMLSDLSKMFDIAARKKIWFAISIIFIVAGLISFGVRGFNFGIDFTGGTIIDLKFDQPVSIVQVRDSLRKHGLDSSTIQLSGENSGVESSNAVMIRTVDLEENERKSVMNSLREDLGNYQVMREEKVGATIGSELIFNAVMALVISWAFIILYIAIRFEFKFGIAAVLALVHDILIVLAFFSFTQRQVDSSFVAALLTVVGYSINDTIVIFDRIRENLRLHFKRGGDINELVNRSIYQTITRSLYTVFTVLFTVLALLIFGGETTKDFAFALLVGIGSGCYSSIFIAAPLWSVLRNERKTAQPIHAAQS